MCSKMHQASESGQALLIIILVMVIALTVGLSLASRSITNLRNTTDEAASQAAFSAAEAGVEQAVKLGDTTGKHILSGVYLNSPSTNSPDKNHAQISNVDITSISGNKFLLNNGNPIFADDGTDVWLSPHSDTPSQLFTSPWAGPTLYVYWGTTNDPQGCSDPAVEVLVISGARTAPTLSKYAFDACAARRTVNSFCAVGAGGSCPTSQAKDITVDGVDGSQTFKYHMELPVSQGLLARIIPLYKAGSIGVEGGGLPVQGKIITSTGTAGASGTQTVRKVSFFQGYDSLPSEVFFSLFTPKN